MRRMVLTWLCGLLIAGAGVAGEAQFKDAGFETNLEGGVWQVALNDAPNATVEFDRVEPCEGVQALKIRLPAASAKPVVVGQTVTLDAGAPRPSEVLFRYQASKANGAKVVVAHRVDGAAWTELPALSLPAATGGFRLGQIDLKALPADARQLRLEFRAAEAGTYQLDEVRFDYTVDDQGGAPDTLLLVGLPNYLSVNDVCDLFYDNLKERGWKRFKGISYAQLSKEELARARTVLLFNGEIYLGIEGRNLELKKALVEYVRAGGGLIITQDNQQQMSRMWFRHELMKDFGGRMLLEVPQIPKENRVKVGAWDHDEYTYTDRVFPPLNEGVKNVVIEAAIEHHGAYDPLVPFLPTDDWKVVLTCGKDIGSKPFDQINEMGLAIYEGVCRPEGFTEDTPLVGIREFGAGRVAYWGIQGLFFYRDFTSAAMRPVLKAVLTEGLPGGPPSDNMRFLNNLFDWVSAKAPNLDRDAIPALKTQEEYDRALGQDFKLFKGVIGARTTWSTGKSTPAEYVAKAKAAGLDFIVFLEEMAAMDAEKYERFRAECLALNDDAFSVWCGLTFQNDYGNHQYIFSTEPIFPGQKYLTNEGKTFRAIFTTKPFQSMDLDYGYGMLGFLNNIGWYRFDKSPYGPTDMRTVQSMAVLTQEDGKTVEDAFDVYNVNTRNGQLLFPQALTLMKSADEIDLLADGTYYMTTAGYDGVAQFRRNMMRHGGANRYPDENCTGFTGVTNGPVALLDMPRGDMDPKHLYGPVLNHWPYTVKASSPAGLDRVELWDGDQIIRTWRPQGETEFDYAGIITNDRQRYLWLRVYDRDGKQAFTRAIGSNSFLLRENQCGDRENQLFYSQQSRPNPDDPPFLSLYGADTCLPDKGPWLSRIRPVGFFVFDEKLGVSSTKGLVDGSPEDHPKMGMIPSISYDGQHPKNLNWQSELVAGREAGLHNLPRRIVASSNALVGDRVLDAVFPPEFENIISVWGSLFPLAGPSEYVDTFGRCTLFLPKVDGVVPYLWEQDLKLLQDIPTGGGQPVVRFGAAGGSSNTTRVIVYRGGELYGVDEERKQCHETFDFNPGDFVLYLDRKYGSLVVSPLSEGLVFVNGSYFMKWEDAVIPADTVMNIRLIGAGIHKLNEDPVAVAHQIVKGYGLKDGKPSYTVALDRGTVDAQQFTLEMTAADGAVAGKLAGVADLPGNLGSRIAGLRDQWTAVVAVPDKMRVIPVEQGMGYAVLTAQEDSQPLFLGHPFVSDDEGLTLALSQAADHKTWVLEIHNPRDTAVVARVRNHDDFTRFALDETLEIAAGASQSILLTE